MLHQNFLSCRLPSSKTRFGIHDQDTDWIFRLVALGNAFSNQVPPLGEKHPATVGSPIPDVSCVHYYHQRHPHHHRRCREPDGSGLVNGTFDTKMLGFLICLVLHAGAITLLPNQEIIIDPHINIPTGVSMLGLDSWFATPDAYSSATSTSGIAPFLQLSLQLSPGIYDVFIQYVSGNDFQSLSICGLLLTFFSRK